MTERFPLNPAVTSASGEMGPGDDSNLPEPHAPGGIRTFNATGKPNMLVSIVVISVGAALGALLRWYLANRLNASFPALPPGTLAANMVGGYLIGVAMAVFLAFPALSPYWRLLTVTGFLGGLTTFSTFSAEVVTALLAGRTLWAVSTVGVHVCGSVVMTLLGVATVRLARILL